MELIVSDDASGALDRDSISEYIEKNKKPNLVSYLINENKRNLGTVAHANFAVSLTGGEFIRFAACGDGFFGKDALTRLYLFAEKHKVPVVTSKSGVCSHGFSRIYYYFPDSRRVNVINRRKPADLYKVIAVSNIISSAGTLYRRSFFSENGGFNEAYRYLEDLPTWLRLLRNGIPIPCLEEATTYYAVDGVSSRDGNAFKSELLRPDLIKCYEEEILPYLERFSFIKRKMIRYQYDKLKSFGSMSRFAKVRFFLVYFPFEIYGKAKSLLKRLLKSVKR